MSSLNRSPRNVCRLILLSLILMPLCSLAATNTDTSSIGIPTSPPTIASEVVSELIDAAPVSLDRLASLRGGTEVVNNEQKLTGVVSQNSAENVISGANTISNGAFANASGIPIVIQNSGANVLIQNATVINLQIK